MSSGDGRTAGPAGPPWPVTTVADLHAGVFDEDVAAALWPRVRTDADAAAILAALDRTRVELAAAGSLAPMRGDPARMPPDVAARIDDVIAAQYRTAPSGNAQVTDLSAARTARRRRKNRFLGAGGGAIATAAAAVIAVVLALGPGVTSTGGHGVAAAPPQANAGAAAPPFALRSGDLGRATLGKAMGKHEEGPFSAHGKLEGCLRANDVRTDDPAIGVVGMTQITYNSEAATLIVLTTGKQARFRLLVVGQACAAGEPATLGNVVVGPK